MNDAQTVLGERRKAAAVRARSPAAAWNGSSRSRATWWRRVLSGSFARKVEHPIGDERVEVNVEVEGALESLDGGDATGPRIGHPQPPRATVAAT